MTKKSTDITAGRYAAGGSTTIFPNRLGWWERFNLAKDIVSDVKFTVTAEYTGRPDLIANAVYGDAHTMWVILQYNNIVDPIAELSLGKQITLPHPNRLPLLLPQGKLTVTGDSTLI